MAFSPRHAINAFKRIVLRDEFQREVHRWVQDEGDATLRLQYPLDPGAVVWDVGGYKGDFAAEMLGRFGCRVVIFEPLEQFSEHCETRFDGEPRIEVVTAGLAGSDGSAEMSSSDDASSAIRRLGDDGRTVAMIGVRSAFERYGAQTIDLLKVNIEGGEYELLEELLDSGLIGRVRHLQVQFHDFFPDASARRDRIRARLAETHVERWCYRFVWESWELA